MVKWLRLGGARLLLGGLRLLHKKRLLPRASHHIFYAQGYMREEVDALRRECEQTD